MAKIQIEGKDWIVKKWYDTLFETLQCSVNEKISVWEKGKQSRQLDSMGTTQIDGYCGRGMEDLGEVDWHRQYTMIKTRRMSQTTPDFTELDQIFETGASL